METQTPSPASRSSLLNPRLRRIRVCRAAVPLGKLPRLPNDSRNSFPRPTPPEYVLLRIPLVHALARNVLLRVRRQLARKPVAPAAVPLASLSGPRDDAALRPLWRMPLVAAPRPLWRVAARAICRCPVSFVRGRRAEFIAKLATWR